MTVNYTEKVVANSNVNSSGSNTKTGDFRPYETTNQTPSKKGKDDELTAIEEKSIIPGDASEATPIELESSISNALRYQLMTSEDMCKLPAFEWLIKGVLPALGLVAIFGPSGSGKSFLVLDMLHSLALGHDWFGHKVKQCSLTYVALEGEAGVSNRIKAYVSRHELIPEDIRYVTQPFNLLDNKDIYELADAIQAAGTTDVVVVDTLSRATSGSDENDSKAMGQIVSAAKMLQELIGGLVILIHHTGKDSSRGMRGHSSLHAALDCAIEVKRNKDYREWTVAKSKDGEDGASHSFKLEVVSLGNDSDGEEITSCVIVGNQSAQPPTKKTPSLSRNQKIALQALEDSLSTAIDVGISNETPDKPLILFEKALEMVTPLMSGGMKHKKQRAMEALEGLVKKNVVGIDGSNLCFI